jgi:hypothetical protein
MDLAQTFEGTLLHELTHAIKKNDSPEGDPNRVFATDDMQSAIGKAYGAYPCAQSGSRLTLARLEDLCLPLAIWSQPNHGTPHHRLWHSQR